MNTCRIMQYLSMQNLSDLLQGNMSKFGVEWKG